MSENMVESEIGVLVAVGPDGIHDGVLDVAAAQALRLGLGVELLHVVHSVVVAVPTSIDQVSSIDRALTEVGRAVLGDAAERLRPRLEGRVPLTVEIGFGPVARTIAQRGSRGKLIVLERRSTDRLERLLTMSVSTSVAAHAHVPVVVVPSTWSSAPGAALPVTVCVDRPLDAEVEVPPALAHARALDRPLVVLHAAWLAEPYQDVVFASGSPRQWIDEATHELHSSLKGVPGAEADLTCDVRWGRPVDTLVKASQTSSLLVLHRRPATRPMAAHLGPVTRAVLRHSACPVLVIDRIGDGDHGSS
jgi:nucleotide-binding universal stress UspA family protein